MQQERKGLRRPGVQHHIRADSGDPVGKSLELEPDDLCHESALESLAHQRGLTARKRLQAPRKRVALLGERLCSNQGTGHDGLDHGQQISSPMCEFTHKKPLMLFNMLPLGNVVSTIDCAYDFSAFIPKRTDIDDGSNPRAVGPLDDYPVSYTHLRAHETVLDLVCRLLLEK